MQGWLRGLTRSETWLGMFESLLGPELLEVKTIQVCPSRYSTTEERGEAVNRRAKTVPVEYEKKAQKADVQFNGCGVRNITACRSAGCDCCDRVGPIRRELRKYKVTGLAFGAYGEASKSVRVRVRVGGSE